MIHWCLVQRLWLPTRIQIGASDNHSFKECEILKYGIHLANIQKLAKMIEKGTAGEIKSYEDVPFEFAGLESEMLERFCNNLDLVRIRIKLQEATQGNKEVSAFIREYRYIISEMMI